MMKSRLMEPSLDTEAVGANYPEKYFKKRKAIALDLATVKNTMFAPEGTQIIDPRKNFLDTPPAMIFRPTKEEFSDPYKYIKKIKPDAEKCGIAKIIPPDDWNVEFALETERFWFTTRIQRLSHMEGSSRNFLNYMDQLQKFHNQQGSSLSHIPVLDRKPINLLKLKASVDSLGGYKSVTENKQWAAVGRAIGLGGKTCTSLSHSIKRVFTRWIQPYEEYIIHDNLRSNRLSSVNKKIKNDDGSPQVSEKKETSQEPKSESNTEAIKKEIEAEDKNDDYKSKNKNKDSKKRISNGLRLGRSNPGEEICELCGCGDNDEKMLLCDGCDKGYHLYCFNPPIMKIPDADWFCPHCLKSTKHSYGFEEKEVRSLHKFQKIANKFKEDYFREKMNKSPDEPIYISEDDCEREFWETAENSYNDLSVEYGADLHSSHHGSGFPTIEKQPYNEYSRSPWNLNILPLMKGSMLNYTKKNNISGIMTPWLYVGMLFSAFCWHTEDQYLYSISYSHWGETKTWYGLPACSASGLEATMRKEFPDLFNISPDLLFHITTLMSPKVLMENGITPYFLDQRPGEFVVTFPGAYHSGFSHGFNFTEAVNFALPDWLPMAYECAERNANYNKAPLFPHEEVVVLASKDILSGELVLDEGDFTHVINAVHTMSKSEIGLRNKLRSTKTPETYRQCSPTEDPVYISCSLCSRFCYLSCIELKQNNGQESKIVHYCLHHSDNLPSTEEGDTMLLVCFFGDDEIKQLEKDMEAFNKIYKENQSSDTKTQE